MSDPFIGEVRVFPYGFVPEGWLLCDGAIQRVAENQALYSVIGATYGGDGQRTFALPDLRGRAVMGAGKAPGVGATAYSLGETSGLAEVALTEATLPRHDHRLSTPSPPTAEPYSTMTSAPNGEANLTFPMPGPARSFSLATGAEPDTTLATNTISPAGAGIVAEHNNLQPYLALVFAIATTGSYPIRP